MSLHGFVLQLPQEQQLLCCSQSGSTQQSREAQSVPTGLWWQLVVPSSPQSHLPAWWGPSQQHPSLLPCILSQSAAWDGRVPFPSTCVTAPCHLCTAFLGSLFFDSRLPSVQRQMFLLAPAGILAGSILDSPARPHEGLGESSLPAGEKLRGLFQRKEQ